MIHLIKIQDFSGRTIEQAVQRRASNLLNKLRRCGKQIQDALLWTTRDHFQTIYPGSRHYDPDKVQPDSTQTGAHPEGSIDIDVPGVARAYHDLDIKPIHTRALTIPLHRMAYGKRAGDFANTFVVKKRDGKALIAAKQGTGIVFLFALVKRAFQRRDERLMPSDYTFGKNIESRVHAHLDRTLGQI